MVLGYRLILKDSFNYMIKLLKRIFFPPVVRSSFKITCDPVKNIFGLYNQRVNHI